MMGVLELILSANSQPFKMKSGKFSAKVGSKSNPGSVRGKIVSANNGIVSRIVICSSSDSIYTRSPVVSPLEMTWIPNFSRMILYQLPRKTSSLWLANSMIPQVWQHPSCSLSGPYLAKFVEILSAPSTQFCPENTPTNSGAQSGKFYSPKKYPSLARSYSTTQLNYSFSLMAVYRGTEHASMPVQMINSTFSTALQRYWGRLHTPPHNLR